MNFGITVPNFGKFADRESILDISIAAEELGFDSLWVSDHVVLPKNHKGFGNVFYDPLVTLSFIAQKTKSIKLGTSVIVLPYRNPVVLAKQISTLDALSEGRVVFGVGAGWLKEEFEALGASYAERGQITDEYLEIIKELYTNDSPSYKGKNYKFSDISFYPKPVQKPYPPIWVGGNSRNALKRAVKYGSGWHVVGSTPKEISEEKTFINELLLKYNKTETDFTVSVRKNLQITRRDIKDKTELLRGDIDKISAGIEVYNNAGVKYMVFQILSSDFKGVMDTMKIMGKHIKTSGFV